MRASRHLAFLVAFAGLLSSSGCVFHYGTEEEWDDAPKVNRLTPDRFSQKKAWLRSFKHSLSGGLEKVGPGVGETVSTSKRVSPFILESAKALPFASVTAGAYSERDYILQGELSYTWSGPWWTLVQLIDLWFHAWFIPTLGNHLVLEFELRLFDAEHRPLRKWTARRTVKYMGNIWWLIWPAKGQNKPYLQFLNDAFRTVGDELRQLERKAEASR